MPTKRVKTLTIDKKPQKVIIFLSFIKIPPETINNHFFKKKMELCKKRPKTSLGGI